MRLITEEEVERMQEPEDWGVGEHEVQSSTHDGLLQL